MTNDSEARVTALEERMDMVAGLRAAGDRDLADIGRTVRAQHFLIQALGITRSDHTAQLRVPAERTSRMEVTLEAVRADQMAGKSTITGMLSELIERDSRAG